MGSELRYSFDTYPLTYALWAAVAVSWVLAIAGLVVRLARARPVARFDRLPARIAAALRDSTVQRPVWRRPLGGVMHLGIMLGALLVLMTFVITHYVTPRGSEWSRSHLPHALVDAAMLLVLIGLAVAAWRRHFRRGEGRVVPAPPARAEDVGLWALLLVGVLTALLSEALLITLALPAWRRSAFLSAPIAALLEGMSKPLRRGLYGWSWSVLHAAVLGMAFLLPWTKWRHLVLAPVALLTRKSAPLARLDAVDLDTDGPFGALRRRDLTWKESLDLAACVHCGRCSQACPAATAAAGDGGLDPRRLLETLAAADSAGPLAEACGEDAIWQCATCMACDDVCPIGISPLSLVIDLRRERVLDAARFPQPLRDLFDGLTRRGNPWGLAQAERDDWLASLNGDGLAEGAGGALPTLAPDGETDVLLWLGCMGGYDVRARNAVLALAQLLRRAGVRYAVLGADEGCCGDPARRAGNEALWVDLAEANIAAFSSRRFERIVTLCPHCANTLAHEYLTLGAPLPVVHAAAYVADLVREGRLAPVGRSAGGEATAQEHPLRVTLHDPCYLARGMGDTASARTLLAALPGVDLVELPHHGRDALCCGAGGGRMWLEEPDAPRLGEPRLAELAAAEVVLCITACPYCHTMIADGGADRVATEPAAAGDFPEVCDLVELLAQACPDPAIDHTPAPTTTARDQE